MADKWNERLIYHAVIGMTVGLVAGVLYIFALTNGFIIAGAIGLEFQLPGRVEAWRAAHVGSLMNGLLVLAFAFVISRLSMSAAERSLVGKAALITIYGNIAFYVFAILAPNRGLSAGGNLHGPGNLMGFLSFTGGVVAMIAVFVAVYVMGKAAHRALSGAGAADTSGSTQAAE
jgi:hypothetical protein